MQLLLYSFLNVDLQFSRFPFYFELKIAFVIWLLSPYTKGSSVLYRKFVHPTLSKKEKVLIQLAPLDVIKLLVKMTHLVFLFFP